jgi:hypothetical protein
MLQSSVKLPNGLPYNYTVAQSSWLGGKGDVVDMYVNSSKRAKKPFGLYITWVSRHITLLPCFLSASVVVCVRYSLESEIGGRWCEGRFHSDLSAAPGGTRVCLYCFHALRVQLAELQLHV